MTKIKDVYLVLAINQTNMYQFVGQGSLLETFKSYQDNSRRITSQSIVISSKNQQINDRRQDYRSVASDMLG